MSVKTPFLEKHAIHAILMFTRVFAEEVTMDFTPELKTELKKAIRFSGFATLIVVTILLFQFRSHTIKNRSRGLASESTQSESCAVSDQLSTGSSSRTTASSCAN